MMSRLSFSSILGSLLFALLLLAPTILADQEQQFQDLVRDVPEDKLHAALHDYNGAKFKHGVFPGDRPALEVLHRERAADAVRIVQLAKRQSNSTTTNTSRRNTGSTTTTSGGASPTRTPTNTETTLRTTSAPVSITPAASTTRRGTTSFTSKVTKTVTGQDGAMSTLTETTVVIPTGEPDNQGEDTGAAPTTTSDGPPGLQQPNNGLRVSGSESAFVAAIAALGFFML